LPLLVLYEVLAHLISGDGGVRNGADVLLKSLFLLVGGKYGLTAFAVVLLGIGLYLVARDWRLSGAPRPRLFLGMMLEAVVYAFLFGGVTSVLTGLLLRGPRLMLLGGSFSLPTELMVSLGAGIYEEILFRVVLVGALAQLALKGFKWGATASGLFATIVGAFIFSAFHYIGPYGDELQLSSFAFRMVAGLLLSALYLLRGLGITAWTHALYDVILTLRG
ncbi:MAG TPA: CPBP family glutamic-type intramembrane protease, partial [Gemmatimonadales bacterium]|nr:CPBP family glutamic-type intramembrane protease [Gemmatimonadales bacterium]